MAEARNYIFDHREVAELLIKQQDIHTGLWTVYFEFGFTAATVPTGPDMKTFAPASINFINKVGIQRVEIPSNLSVDAAVVNPRKKPGK